MLTAEMSTRAVACDLNVHFSTIRHLKRCFSAFGSSSNQLHGRTQVTKPAQDLRIQPPHLQDHLRLASSAAAAATGLRSQRIRNHVREAPLHAGSQPECSSSS